MASILLTEEEYNEIQTLLTAALARIENASPRLASHYSKVAQIHADFLSKEDAKKASRVKKTSTSTTLAQHRQKRQQARLQEQINKQNAAQAPASQDTGRKTSTK